MGPPKAALTLVLRRPLKDSVTPQGLYQMVMPASAGSAGQDPISWLERTTTVCQRVVP